MAAAPQASFPRLRTLAFGAAGDGVWGAAWLPTEAGLLALGRPGGVEVSEVTLSEDDGGPWTLRASGIELTVHPRGDEAGLDGGPSGLSGFEQLCTVSGAGEDVEAFEAPGLRGERSLPDRPERFDSIREIAAWFEPDEGMAVTALRGRRQRGHEGDVAGGILLGPEGSPPVLDPRLSTTYTADGRPKRMTLELWFDEEVERYPRRAAGEAAGPGAQARELGWDLRVQWLRCHSRGREGSGVYLLARPA